MWITISLEGPKIFDIWYVKWVIVLDGAFVVHCSNQRNNNPINQVCPKFVQSLSQVATLHLLADLFSHLLAALLLENRQTHCN